VRYVICTLIPTGPPLDQLRIPYPTAVMIAGPFAGKALVAIPDEDFQDELGSLPADATQKLSAWLTARGVPQPIIDRAVAIYGDPDVTLALAPSVLTRLQQRLNRRYREHAGEYNPNVG
jgi:hypothetical protein